MGRKLRMSDVDFCSHCIAIGVLKKKNFAWHVCNKKRWV